MLLMVFGVMYVSVRVAAIDTIAVNKQRLIIERAETSAQLEQGLSDRDSLPENHGMLFVFNKLGQQCMWMKDMRFNLDMLWLDEKGKVTALQQNLSPSSYPHSFCATGKYVLEVRAGYAAKYGLVIGSTFNL